MIGHGVAGAIRGGPAQEAQADPTAGFTYSARYRLVQVVSWLCVLLGPLGLILGAWMIHDGLVFLVAGWLLQNMGAGLVTAQYQIGQRDLQRHVAAFYERFAQDQDAKMREEMKAKFVESGKIYRDTH
jgi:hypothetical protein